MFLFIMLHNIYYEFLYENKINYTVLDVIFFEPFHKKGIVLFRDLYKFVQIFSEKRIILRLSYKLTLIRNVAANAKIA